MNKFFCIVAGSALLLAAPAVTKPASAQQAYGGGYNNIWSSAQGTSDSYGAAHAFDGSTSGALATAGGGGVGSGASGGFIGGGITSAFTTSTAGTSSNGSGYAQAQTSGYAGGNVSGYGARLH
jgi:hypothetical protein